MRQALEFIGVGLVFILSVPMAHATVLDELIANYQTASGQTFDVKSGEALWKEKHSRSGGQSRSCTSCHGNNLEDMGKHIRTMKKIKPMAPSVNAKRFTKAKFIEKWFRRNCQWTWRRECTASEKGQLLMFLKKQ